VDLARRLQHASGVWQLNAAQARVGRDKGSISHLLTEAAGLDIAQGLGVLLSGDKNLTLNCARLDGSFKAGVLRPRTAVIDNRDSRITIDGRVSLADETLDLRVAAHPKDFSLLTLRSPVRVKARWAPRAWRWRARRWVARPSPPSPWARWHRLLHCWPSSTPARTCRP